MMIILISIVSASAADNPSPTPPLDDIHDLKPDIITDTGLYVGGVSIPASALPIVLKASSPGFEGIILSGELTIKYDQTNPYRPGFIISMKDLQIKAPGIQSDSIISSEEQANALCSGIFSSKYMITANIEGENRIVGGEISKEITDKTTSAFISENYNSISSAGLYVKSGLQLDGTGCVTFVGSDAAKTYGFLSSSTIIDGPDVVAEGGNGGSSYGTPSFLQLRNGSIILAGNTSAYSKGNSFDSRLCVIDSETASLFVGNDTTVYKGVWKTDSWIDYIIGSDLAEYKYLKLVLPETYGFWVSGVMINEYNKDDVLGDGTVRYNPEINVLTLENARINENASAPVKENSNSDYGIRTSKDVTIEVVGYNIVNGINKTGYSAGIGCDFSLYDNNITFTGGGILVASGGEECSIASFGMRGRKISVDGCILVLKGGLISNKEFNSYGMGLQSSELEVSDGVVLMTGEQAFNGIMTLNGSLISSAETKENIAEIYNRDNRSNYTRVYVGTDESVMGDKAQILMLYNPKTKAFSVYAPLPSNQSIFVAEYDVDGRMIAVHSVSTPGGSFPASDEMKKIKAFCMDNNGKPVCQNAEIKIK